MQEFEEFEKEFLFDMIKIPDYRLGQAFYNKFTDISKSMNNDGDLGTFNANRLWLATSRDEVLKLVGWYIKK